MTPFAYSSNCLKWKPALWSTNLNKVFEIVLDKAVKNNLLEDDMPTKFLIISDMEFNQAEEGETNYEAIKKLYNEAGYKLPTIIFWNVNSAQGGNSPVRFDEDQVALISGASPAIIQSVLGGEIDPIKVMFKTLNSERYSIIV